MLVVHAGLAVPLPARHRPDSSTLSGVEIVAAQSPSHLLLVRKLFEEYWQSFGFALCLQNFTTEVAALPGDYTPPAGRLALAFIGPEMAGMYSPARRQYPL